MLLLVTSGLSHLPPIKVVTILAGVAQVSFVFFVVSCIVARGARFFALAWALRRYGDPIREFIERRLGLLAAIVAGIIILLYIVIKYSGIAGSITTC
jgi:membrane protein DedA with SNARE-associated domain